MLERDGYLPGVPCWVDTSQPDPEAAVAFYGNRPRRRFNRKDLRDALPEAEQQGGENDDEGTDGAKRSSPP